MEENIVSFGLNQNNIKSSLYFRKTRQPGKWVKVKLDAKENVEKLVPVSDKVRSLDLDKTGLSNCTFEYISKDYELKLMMLFPAMVWAVFKDWCSYSSLQTLESFTKQPQERGG